MNGVPCYFGPAERALFGWLHRPAGAPRGALVIVKPFGYEAVCSHRTVRALAEAACEAGWLALRFDADGTGDSAGNDLDPGRVPAWLAGVGAAIEFAKADAGVVQVALLGIRLGALLAATAAAARNDVSALIAIAPVVSGRAYVRELKLMQGALGHGAPPSDFAPDPDLQEAIGFALTAETRAALGALDLAEASAAPAPRVLVLDRDDLPAADRWLEALRASGVDLTAQRLPGYVEMMFDPHKAVVPTAMVQAAMRWLAALPPVAAAGAAEAAPVPVPVPVPVPALRDTARFGAVIERAVTIGGLLSGILTLPATHPPNGRALLLLNAGAVPRIGPNRLYTQLARHWAARGYLVLRVDQSGIGDSATRAGEPDNIVYSDHALADATAALDFLRAQPQVRELRAIGLCSGAYHALKSAVHGDALAGVIVINPLTFFWTEDQSLDFPAFKVASDAGHYGRAALDAGKWRKALRGQVNVWRAAQTVARYGASRVLHWARDTSRRVGLPWRADLGAELESVSGRRIDLQFVFAGDDPGLALLRTQAGSALPKLQRRGTLTIRTIDGPDHTFTPLWSHAALRQVLDRALGDTDTATGTS